MTTRAGNSVLGLRACNSFCTASKISRSIKGGTGTVMTSASGFNSFDLPRLLN